MANLSIRANPCASQQGEGAGGEREDGEAAGLPRQITTDRAQPARTYP